MRSFAPPVPIIRDCQLTDVDPHEEPVMVELRGGSLIAAYPVGFSEPVTLHDTLPDLPAVRALWSFLPGALNEHALALGAAVARGELAESEAAVCFFEQVVSGSSAPAEELGGATSPWLLWAEAWGLKGDRRTVARCSARGDWATTEGLLCAAALRILRGEIALRGVLAPESCLGRDPLPYLAEAAALAGLPTPLEALLDESVAVAR